MSRSRVSTSPIRRVATALASPLWRLQRILEVEAASSIVLFVATATALVWANLGGTTYDTVWHTPLHASLGPWSGEPSLHAAIDDGLMTLFFFVVGLEIRRESVDGELSTRAQAALPVAAALGGMLVPAAMFTVLNANREGAAAWGVPMATDIAFAVGALALLGARVPSPLRILLLALAVIDDIGAIVVIAVFYTAAISVDGFAIAGGGVIGVLLLQRLHIRSPLAYVIPGVVVWVGFSRSGIHPTIAGVVLGLLTPARGDDSPAKHLVDRLQPWVAFVVMPVFALANAGIVIGDARFSGDHAWLFAGLVLALVLGKPIGITLAALVSTKLGIAARSDAITLRGLILVGLVGGIGFTMSLFVAQLAFAPGPLLDTAKLAILVGSGVACIAGLLFGLVTQRRVATRPTA